MCTTFAWASKTAVELSIFLIESFVENETLAFDDLDFDPFRLFEPFGRPRPDGVKLIEAVFDIDEW